VVIWILVVYAVIFTAWLVYPRWRERGRRRAAARGSEGASVDPLFSDPDLLRVCDQDLATVVGEHSIDDLDRLEALLGPDKRDWLLARAGRHASNYSLEAAACDVIQVLSRGPRGPERVLVRVAVRLPGRRRPGSTAEAFWTMAKLDGTWTRTAVEGVWDGRPHFGSDQIDPPAADLGPARGAKHNSG
jgi:hypothetical protein